MFWRRRPSGESAGPAPAEADGGAATVPDAEIEAQLEAELAAADAALAEAAAEGTTTMPEPIGGPAGAVEPEPVGPADLGAGVARSRGGFVARLRGLFGLGEPDAATWEEVEETLIAGDVGATLAIEVVARAMERHDPAGPESAVRAELAALLAPRDAGWDLSPADSGRPGVVLVVGVNGTGKTTSIGKLAARERAAGRRVLLAAADTFRAAAIDQLRLWGERAGVPVVAHAPGADPGAVVFDALDAAVARGLDLVIADTAGRLHTKVNLMDELAKVRRVIDRRLPGVRPEVLFVLDATTGQNGLAQARAFHEAIGLTGIVLAKLDSTAKGGIVFAIEHDLAVPVRFVGVGEKIGDLLPFDPDAFVAALFG
ncbi:MAG: signal recognition particle-docking protein FtsY [Chloroflexi bacterium]|nr:signal recognition particle-docking protein FtsY [Chloroflexota bacterium]